MSSEAGSSPTADSEDARGRVAASARVGMFAPFDLLERGPEAARAFLAQASDAGIDHVCCGDHVSFAGAGPATTEPAGQSGKPENPAGPTRPRPHPATQPAPASTLSLNRQTKTASPPLIPTEAYFSTVLVVLC
jgi:hypothetical protein